MRNPFTLPQASLGEAENSRQEHRLYPLMSDKSVTRLGRMNAVPDPIGCLTDLGRFIKQAQQRNIYCIVILCDTVHELYLLLNHRAASLILILGKSDGRYKRLAHNELDIGIMLAQIIEHITIGLVKLLHVVGIVLPQVVVVAAGKNAEYIGIFGIHILISAIVDKLEIITRARTVDKADMLIRIFITEGRGDGVDKGMTYLMVEVFSRERILIPCAVGDGVSLKKVWLSLCFPLYIPPAGPLMFE